MNYSFDTKVLGLDMEINGDISFDSDDTGAHWAEFELDNIKFQGKEIETDDLTESFLDSLSALAEAACIQEAQDAAEDQGGNDDY